LATVRQTAAANASALEELERAFAAETVTNKSSEASSSFRKSSHRPYPLDDDDQR
jgi:hypothetical protein